MLYPSIEKRESKQLDKNEKGNSCECEWFEGLDVISIFMTWNAHTVKKKKAFGAYHVTLSRSISAVKDDMRWV